MSVMVSFETGTAKDTDDACPAHGRRTSGRIYSFASDAVIIAEIPACINEKNGKASILSCAVFWVVAGLRGWYNYLILQDNCL